MKKILGEMAKAVLVAAVGVLANKLGERLFMPPDPPADPVPARRRRRSSARKRRI